MTRSTRIGALAALLSGWLAFSAGADVHVWHGFDDAGSVEMSAGSDLLVGTSDDVFFAGFNSNGDFAHNFVLDRLTSTVIAASAFSIELTANDAPPLGSDGTSTDFSQVGQSVDDIPVENVAPFFYEDVPGAPPHEYVGTASGRVYSFDYRSRNCLETDPTCSSPLNDIRFIGDGLVMLPGDDPATIVSNAPDVVDFFQVYAGGQADVAAYLSQLASLAPVGWQAISLSTYAMLIETGVNCTGSACPDDDLLIGVSPTYTLPEPTSALATFAAAATLAGLSRRRRASASRGTAR